MSSAEDQLYEMARELGQTLADRDQFRRSFESCKKTLAACHADAAGCERRESSFLETVSKYSFIRDQLQLAFAYARHGDCADAISRFQAAARDDTRRVIARVNFQESIGGKPINWVAAARRLAKLCESGGMKGEAPRPGAPMKPFRLLEVDGAPRRGRRRR